MRTKALKIGNAGGYWGDDPKALERQVNGGRLDYISMDFLAEITMSIMQKQRSRDPKAGYAADFIGMVKGVLKKTLADKTCIISNAGGVNPEGCAEAIASLAKEMGLNPKIAVVYGDDILSDIDALRKKGVAFKNMETGQEFDDVASRVLSANVYFGAAAVVEALKFSPDIIVTGRVTDTGITLAPMIHEFGWSLKDWDKLAAGIIAGHMIECGSQVTGGNFTDWKDVSSFKNIGFPIVEMNPDGTFYLTKHEGTGGLVSVNTIREQVFYEMGDPKGYITPDVVADFSTIKLEDAGKDRVRVYGIKGFEPTPLYKVSMAYADGYKAVNSILISGPDARKKAEVFNEIFWAKCDMALDAKESEYFGWNACHRSLGHADDASEITLRLGARSKSQDVLKKFTKLVPSLILSGPSGVAVTGGASKPQEVVSYWPALMPKEVVNPKVARYENGLKDIRVLDAGVIGNFKPIENQGIQVAEQATQSVSQMLKDFSADGTALSTICLGRSGDKGDTCNIGILARSPEAFAFLDQYLTAERVKNWFQELCTGKVIRYRLEGLLGFNFLLESSLGGGGTMTMRSDAQGKTFAQGLIRQKIKIPANVLQSIKK